MDRRCRYGEIRQLEWSQVDLNARIVRLRDTQTMSAEARIIPLGAELFVMLLAQKARRDATCPDSPWVFFRPSGTPIVEIRKAWAKAVKATGINRLFHDLRRTGVRNRIRAGVPEKVAMLISGHKTRSVFERYNFVDERDLRAAVEKLSLLAQPPLRTQIAQI